MHTQHTAVDSCSHSTLQLVTFNLLHAPLSCELLVESEMYCSLSFQHNFLHYSSTVLVCVCVCVWCVCVCVCGVCG